MVKLLDTSSSLSDHHPTSATSSRNNSNSSNNVAGKSPFYARVTRMPWSRVVFFTGLSATVMLQSQVLFLHTNVVHNSRSISELKEELGTAMKHNNLSSIMIPTANNAESVTTPRNLKVDVDDMATELDTSTETTQAPVMDVTTAPTPSRKSPLEEEAQVVVVEDKEIHMPSSALFERDELCGGCRWTPSRNNRCGKLIAKELEKADHKINVTEAARRLIATGLQDVCKQCLECEDHYRHYWRPDKAAPTVRRATTHYLTTIPDKQYRIPRDILATEGEDQLVEYFSQPQNSYPAKRYLFEYNPSIVPLPSKKHYTTLKINGKTPVYAASYRVGTQQSCFHTNTTREMIGGSWDNKPVSISYVAIALLDEDLSLLADIVIDLPRQFGLREDFRLFVLHNQLYLSSFCKMVRLHIGTPDKPPFSYNNKDQVLDTRPLPPLWPSPLEVTMSKHVVYCSNDLITRTRSKNLNYFVDADTNQTMVELNPAGDPITTKPQPHLVQPVDLTVPGETQQPYGEADIIKDDTVPDRPGFYTVDELEIARVHDFYESPYVADRGSACCVEIQHTTTTTKTTPKQEPQRLLLGISHTKVPYGRLRYETLGLEPNQYLSRFYAMEPTAPYKTVALSGFICLTQYHDAAIRANNPLAQRPLLKQFQIGTDLTLDCPKIHFVTGMTEKVGDPNTLILAYGVADCTSWFVEVDKQQVVDLLFGPPTFQTSTAADRAVAAKQ